MTTSLFQITCSLVLYSTYEALSADNI